MSGRRVTCIAAFLLGLSTTAPFLPSAARTSSIRGRATINDLDLQTGAIAYRAPLAGAEVVVSSAQQTLRTWTDAYGFYRLSGIAPGTYRLACTPPASFRITGPESRQVTLASGKETVVDFTVRTDGQIGGRLLDPRGAPAPGIVVNLAAAEPDYPAFAHVLRAVSDSEGGFGFEDLPPARYLLGIRLESKAPSGFPYPRVYYPSSADSSGAEVIVLREGEKLRGFELVLPRPLPERRIEGIVRIKGRPSPGAWIEWSEMQYPVASRGEMIRCDEQGRFSFTALDGLRYSLFGAAEAGGAGRLMRSGTVVVPPMGDRLDFQLELFPSPPPSNLLRNPGAREGTRFWRRHGDAFVERQGSDGYCFALRNGGYFFQDVAVPKTAAGYFAVLVGFASGERVNADGAITGLPYLHGYMMVQKRILASLEGQGLRSMEGIPNQWGPLYGIFRVPPGTAAIRCFLRMAEQSGLRHDGSAARFTDLGLFLLPTELEARLYLRHFRTGAR